MRNQTLTYLAVVCLVAAGLFAFMARSRASTPSAGIDMISPWAQFQQQGKDAIGILTLEDVIVDTKHLVRTVKDWQDDDSIKALIVEINSPGGAVAPSQALYDALMLFRQKKPVAAVMGSIAASGGYYVASAAHEIWAMRGTLTGSIGVIMQTMDFAQLADRAGVRANIIKTGAFKDTGNPFRRMTTAENEYLQAVAFETYEQFIADILAGREQIKEDQLRPLADGRIFTGTSAQKLGLVDHVGSLHDAVTALASKVGLPVEDTPVRRPNQRWHKLEDLLKQMDIEGRSGFWSLLFGAHKLADPMPFLQSTPLLAIWPGALQL